MMCDSFHLKKKFCLFYFYFFELGGMSKNWFKCSMCLAMYMLLLLEHIYMYGFDR